MANEEHLELIRQGREKWNRWRISDPWVHPDLSGANLSGASLDRVDLSETDLNNANLSGANLNEADLGWASLSGTNLNGASLNGASLSGTNLSKAELRKVDLNNVTLSDANFSGAILLGSSFLGGKLTSSNFSNADLGSVDLRLATLRKSNFSGANLREANLWNADFTETNLTNSNCGLSQAIGTNFTRAIFTGACLDDWVINTSTKFKGVVCNYFFHSSKWSITDRQFIFKDRRPHFGTFNKGDFAILFQQAVDTLDLIFTDGIDWQAFFQSFQDLRSQYADQDLSIQAIEKKRDGAFVVRVEVPEGADKAAIESSTKELYETKLTLLEQRYRAELQAKDGEIVAYREQSANLMEIVKLQASRPITVEATAVADNSTGKNDLRGAQFGGGFIETNYGTQHGGIINNYGSSAADITRLLSALRDQAQTFPTDQKDEANDILDDLEGDLAKPGPDQGRISRRLKKLVALAAAIGTIASGAAAFSGDVSTFTGNVIELMQQLGIPIEHV